jgi:3-methyl-2-oxobutanoate hydroxymethyltransferase
MDRRKVTIPDLYRMKADKQKVTVLTAYDHPGARLAEEAGADVVLVGDSLGMVCLGYDSTVPVTMDQMIHHCAAVRRGLKAALLIGDMPFMSYQVSLSQAVANAGRFVKEAGCDMVKLEGGSEMAPTIEAIVNAGIAVCAHIGLTPQSVSKLGGYKVQGKDLAGAQKLVDGAKALDAAGADMIVFECMPSALAAAITRAVKMVTIGIGAGPDCDGQVLVYHDVLGLAQRKPPKMARQYLNLWPMISQALGAYCQDVRSGAFPDQEHGFAMDQAVVDQLRI